MTTTTHDSINLRRLTRRLQKSVNTQEWNAGSETEQETWIKAMGMLQTVKYARALLKNVELYEEDDEGGSSSDFGPVKEQLEAMYLKMQEITDRITPRPKPRSSLLAQLPRPPIPSQVLPTPETSKEEEETSAAEPEPPRPEAQSTVSAEKLLLSPSELKQQPVPLISKNAASTSVSLSQGDSKPTARSTAAGLQNSQALQQELSDQLALMASQLKRNAQHFSDTLSKDNALVEETGEKLESNFGFMQKERVRLRDHSGKSWNTTWLVFGSITLVLTLFVLMVAIIRVTSR